MNHVFHSRGVPTGISFCAQFLEICAHSKTVQMSRSPMSANLSLASAILLMEKNFQRFVSKNVFKETRHTNYIPRITIKTIIHIHIYICNIYIFCIIAKATKTHARSLHPRFMKIMAHSIGTQTNPHQNHTSMQASFR